MLTRRNLLVTGAATLVAAPAILRAQTLWRNYPFSLGIAAGDPSPDGFVIWTRIAPDPLEAHGGMGMGVLPVKWEVASDDKFASVVASGEALARPELAHAVHVEVAGLQPDRPYFYRFEAGGERSIRGRARTLPLASSSPQLLRFGVAGCQNYEDGYYTAYRHLAREDLAFVYHYGDYIYEYRGDALRPGWAADGIYTPVRPHLGQLLTSLDDYRRRYAQYKMDADLQRAHAAHAFFMAYDDHEVDNNWVGDIDARDTPPEIFRLRRAQALQAWYEHMPVRRRSFPNASTVQGYRSARYGDLAELDILDTRQYRSNQPCGDGFKPACPEVNAVNATMLGKEQEEWLSRNLQRRDVKWNVLAQQVMMMSLDRRRPDEAPPKILNIDSWAGYEAPRQRLLSCLSGLDNVIVLTGDEHQNFAGLLHDRDKPVAVEFVATSISSGGDGQDLRPGSDTILANNPQLRFVNDQRGYLTFDVTPDEWRTNFMVVDRVRTPDGALSKRATWSVARGEPALRPV
ncbi:MAG: alkaline phosphatase D family protein [Pseudomonadota bacterium]|nr:alkaline phosphatase D family protein [Pseudomonadota bacterium]